MSTNVKYLVVGGLALVVVIGIMLARSGQGPTSLGTPIPSRPVTKSGTSQASQKIPITGLPGDAAAAVTRDAEDEATTLETEDNGSTILEADDQDINNFGQSANNYDF